MVILLMGSSYTGKTFLSQKLLEKYKYPYLCVDHLKMGLIRSGNTDLKETDDDKLTAYLWPIIREIIKTVIENNQNLIVEGAYIPFDWKKDFHNDYLEKIKYICLIMTEEYIEKNSDKIKENQSVIENRKYENDFDKEVLKKENKNNLEMCIKYNNKFVLIDSVYNDAKLMDSICKIVFEE